MQVDSEAEFFEMLKVSSKDVVKVVSIFGNTGDGKSHTLNHTFFQGRQIFRTSSDQTSCTAGVWAAHDADRQTIVIDTEGLLGVSNNQNQRTRLLLKVRVCLGGGGGENVRDIAFENVFTRIAICFGLGLSFNLNCIFHVLVYK